MPWKIRPSKDVLATSSGIRRRSFEVDGVHHTLEFGKEPVYLDVLPDEIACDPHLHMKQVTEEEMASAGGVLTRLNAERVQDPILETEHEQETDATAGEPAPAKKERSKK